MTFKDVLQRQIVRELKAAAGTANAGQSSDSYTGSTHTFYAVPVPARRQILKAIVREHRKTATVAEWLQLVDMLITGNSHEEKTMGAYLLGYLPEVRKAAGFAHLNHWLSHLVGWAEVDAFCQNIFTADELLVNWSAWQRFLEKLSRSNNVNKRRAALVFLTAPTSKTADARLYEQAFASCTALSHETDILITKAISWLLRSMADSNPAAVATYLKEHESQLPKIAVRETRRKLVTGKKN